MELNFFACPYCKDKLRYSNEQLVCQKEEKLFVREDGIYRLLTKEREDYFRNFLEKYTIVREKEGWGDNDINYYMSLPYKDTTGWHKTIWKIRAKTFDAAVRYLVGAGLKPVPSQLNVLDIGAGNCWMTRYFSQWGNSVVAVDINLDERDGLKAGQIYIDNLNVNFVRAQAEIENLPFIDGHFDLVIANGSFHYAENYDTAMSEVRRVLKKNGTFIIIDSPTYTDPRSGRAMVAERSNQHERDYGIRHDASSRSGFLVHDEIMQLFNNSGFEVCILRPFHGILWAIRPIKAKLLGLREPARFPVIIGYKL